MKVRPLLFLLLAFSTRALFAFFPLDTTISGAPWELPLYTNADGIAMFRLAFPPFPEYDGRFLGYEARMTDVNWTFKGYTNNSGANADVRLVPVRTLRSNNTLIAGATLPELFPLKPYERIEASFSIAPPTNGPLMLYTPTVWLPVSIALDGVPFSSFDSYSLRETLAFRETIIPESAFKTNSFTVLSVALVVTNYRENVYDYFRATPVSVHADVSNMSAYSEKIDVTYRRSDYYAHAYYRSALAPFPVVESMWKSIFMRGVSNANVALRYVGLWQTNYRVEPLSDFVFYDVERDGPLTENFVLLFGSDGERDYPLLVVFNLPLERMTSYGKGTVQFDFPLEPMYTYLAVVPFAETALGVSEREAKALTRGITKTQYERCKQIARMAFAFPSYANKWSEALERKTYRYERFEQRVGESNYYFLPYRQTTAPKSARAKLETLRVAGAEYRYYTAD